VHVHANVHVNVNVHVHVNLGMCIVHLRTARAGMWTDPPILSRVYQLLSDGMLGFRQARKIEDVPFPWPYAQMVAFLIFIFAAVFPLLVASQMGSETDEVEWLPPLITFFTVLAHSGLYGTATTLEDPFVHPPNDLPSVAMQRAFNARLVASWDALRTPTDDQLCSAAAGEDGVAHKYYSSPEFVQQAVELWAAWDGRHSPDRLAAPPHKGEAVLETAAGPGLVGAEPLQSHAAGWVRALVEGVQDVKDSLGLRSNGDGDARRRRTPSWYEK